MKNFHRLLAAAFAAAFFVGAAQAQNAGTVTNHAFAIGKGAGITGYTSLLCSTAQLAVGQSAADPLCKTITGDVTINASGVTAIGATKVTSADLNADVFSTAHSWAGQQTFTAPILGTPASGTLTNATGLPISTGVSGLGTGCATFLGTPSSANLRGCLTDETGTGAAYFAGGALGTPASGTLTNATGLPISTGLSGAGTGVLTALGNAVNATGGIPSPTPTRAGDVIYWNGSNWVALAGNNSGTQVLQENSSGVPSWVTVSGTGTVTSVICGTGLSGGTITTSGTCAVSLTNLTNSLSADVTMNNGTITNYFSGPTVAQGTSGTWHASGTVTLSDTGQARFNCKLWDGTTVIDSATGVNISTFAFTISLSGNIASPAANIRIDCGSNSVNSKMLFNQSANSKDSTVSVFRIQ